MARVHRERSTAADYTRPVMSRITPWLHAGEAAILVGVTVVLLLTGLLVVVDAFRDIFIGASVYAQYGAIQSTETIFGVIETALLGLILAELVSTLIVSLEGGALRPEPFLVVALVAIVRKILLATAPIDKSIGAFGLPAQDVDLLALTILVLLLGVTLVLVRRASRPVAE
jgi:uncharacterized membrane protein (DUF373 family)